MPLYEYECEGCRHRFEKIQKFSDPHVSACPSCGGKVNKLLSSPAIQFKGTGWYITDYARKPSGGQAAGSSGDDSGSGGKSAGSGAEKAASDKTASSEKTDTTSKSSSSATE